MRLNQAGAVGMERIRFRKVLRRIGNPSKDLEIDRKDMCSKKKNLRITIFYLGHWDRVSSSCNNTGHT